MKVRLIIPLKLPYKNELTPSPRQGAFFRFMAVKREWRAAIPEALPHQRALGPRRLTIVRLMTPAERDFDTGNVYFAAAAIIDIVKQKGYLVDDTTRLCKLAEPVQRLAGAGEFTPCTYIELEDVGADVVTAPLPGMV